MCYSSLDNREALDANPTAAVVCVIPPSLSFNISGDAFIGDKDRLIKVKTQIQSCENEGSRWRRLL